MKKFWILIFLISNTGCFLMGGKSDEDLGGEEKVLADSLSADIVDTTAADYESKKLSDEVLYSNKSIAELEKDYKKLTSERDSIIWEIVKIDSAIAGKPIPKSKKQKKSAVNAYETVKPAAASDETESGIETGEDVDKGIETGMPTDTIETEKPEAEKIDEVQTPPEEQEESEQVSPDTSNMDSEN